MRDDSQSIHATEMGYLSGCLTPRAMRKAHLHHEIEVNYLLQGSLVYLIGGSLVRLEAGKFAMFWGATPHQIISTEDVGKFFFFTIPFVWMLQWKLKKWFVQSILDGNFLTDQTPYATDQASCHCWHEDIQSANQERRNIALLEIEARLRRLILDHRQVTTPSSVDPPLVGAQHIRTMLQIVSSRYMENLRVEEVTRSTGLNPSYAMTLFRKHCGMSIGEYLTQQKLHHAQRLLATTDDKILDICYGSGFQSPSCFYAAYQKYYKESPKAFRRKNRDLA